VKGLLLLIAALLFNGALGIAFAAGMVILIQTLAGWLGAPDA